MTQSQDDSQQQVDDDEPMTEIDCKETEGPRYKISAVIKRYLPDSYSSNFDFEVLR